MGHPRGGEHSESLYNDFRDENPGDKSSMSDYFDGIDSNNDDTAESLESLQKLHAVFLHPNKQKEVQKRMVSNKSHGEFTFTPNWQFEGRITQVDRSEARRGVIYTGDSRTSNLRKRKIQSKAAEGCQSMTVFFQASEETISEEQTA